MSKVKIRIFSVSLLFLAGTFACASQDNPDERTAAAEQRLSASALARVLSFEGQINGTGADWVATNGTSASTVSASTAHASDGSHSLAVSGTYYAAVVSTSLTSLGQVSGTLTLDVWLPTSIKATDSYKGQVQVTLVSSSLNFYVSSHAAFATATPGRFSSVQLPISPAAASLLSNNSYSDLTITLAVDAANTDTLYLDNLRFGQSATGTGGSGGIGGSSASTIVTGGSASVGGTQAAGGSQSNGITGGALSTGGGSTLPSTWSLPPGASTTPPPFRPTQINKICGYSYGDNSECDLTIKNISATETIYHIDRPVVNTGSTKYPEVQFNQGDLVTIKAGGCAQTGGVGLGSKTWKHYVDPWGNGADVKFYGSITIPGGSTQTAFRSLLVNGQATVVIPEFGSTDPSCVYPLNATLELNYADDDYSDNGYWGRDSGNDCDTNVDAWVELDVVRNSGATMVPYDWDMVPSCVDDNYFYTNYRWGWQNPAGVGQTYRTVDYDMSSDASINYVLQNSTQVTGYDSPPSGLDGFFDDLLDLQIEKAAFICRHDSSTLDYLAHWGTIWGHRNWVDASYTAPISFYSHDSTVFEDDDYNIMLQPVADSMKVLWADNLSQSIIRGGLTDNRSQIKAEFDSDETVDHFMDGFDDSDHETWWWKKFHDAVDDSKEAANTLIGGHEAIVIGLVGMDEEHNGGNEIHPVHAIAIRTAPIYTPDPIIPNTLVDHWSIFVRNWGDEGMCSDNQHYVYLPNNEFSLRLPASVPDQVDTSHCVLNGDRSGCPTITRWHFHKAATAGDPTYAADGKRSPDDNPTNPGMLVYFPLQDPTAQGWFAGELNVVWNTKQPNVTPPPPAFVPEVPSSLFAHDDMNWYLAQLTPEQANDLSAIRDGMNRPQAPAVNVSEVATMTALPAPKQRSTKMPTVSTGPARPQWEENWYGSVAALCAATKGAPPELADACSTMPPVTTAVQSNAVANIPTNCAFNPTVVTLTAHDANGSGVNRTEYSLDRTSWALYTHPLTVANGTTLYYRSAANSGQVEPISVLVIPPAASDLALGSIGLMANGNLDIEDGNVINGTANQFAPIFNAGSDGVSLGVTSAVGDIWSAGGVFLRDRSTVHGSIHLMGALTEQNMDTITIRGSVQQLASLSLPDLSDCVGALPASQVLPSPNLQPGTGPIALQSGGRYGAVAVMSSASILLSSGTYYFDTLTVEPQGQILIDESAGPVTIVVATQFSLNGSLVSTTGSAIRPFVMYYGSQDVYLRNAYFGGTIIAPDAKVDIGSATGFNQAGTFIGKNIWIEPNSHLTAMSFGTWSP